MKRFLSLFACSIALFASSIAKDYTFTLANDKGQAQKGTIVTVKGQRTLTRSDKNGLVVVPAYSPADTVQIIVSGSKQIALPARELDQSRIVLGKKEYTITSGGITYTQAYQKIRSKGRSSNTLTREQVLSRGAHTLYDLLRGAFPGVEVVSTGLAHEVRIRGIGTINCSNEPLFIIDGVEFSSSDAANAVCVVENIESIEVNKSGAGFGLKGANGAIIITTVHSAYQTPLTGSEL